MAASSLQAEGGCWGNISLGEDILIYDGVNKNKLFMIVDVVDL
jgi:hypothetical protein